MNTAPNDLHWVLQETRNQTSASFLQRVTCEPGLFRQLLEYATSQGLSDAELAELQQQFGSAYSRARVWKRWNSFFFYFSLVIFFVGTFWQTINLLWVKIDNVFLASLVESFLLVIVGNVCLWLHRFYKRQQTSTEDAMRQTLTAREALQEKKERLAALLFKERSAATPHPPAPRSAEQIFQEASSPGRLAERLGACSRAGPPSLADQLTILVQLMDARIKAYAYRTIGWATLLGLVVFVLLGFFWPLINPWPLDPTAIGTIQSVLILGAGGLCLNTLKQYRLRRQQVEAAMELTLTKEEPLPAKSERLIRVLRSVDTGLEKEEAGVA